MSVSGLPPKSDSSSASGASPTQGASKITKSLRLAKTVFSRQPTSTPPSLKNKQVVDVQKDETLTAITTAISNNNLEDLKELIQKRPFSAYPAPYVDALHLACKLGHREIVESMIAAAPRAVTSPGDNNETSLHIAAKVGQKDIVELLLKNEARPDALDKQGKTAAWRALCQGHLDVAEMLVAKGYKLNANETLLQNNLKLSSPTP